jgi:hypothetical protein
MQSDRPQGESWESSIGMSQEVRGTDSGTGLPLMASMGLERDSFSDQAEPSS